MNPIEVTRHLQDALISYLTTTFDVNRDGQQPLLAADIRTAFEKPGHLFNGPFLELTPPYRRGKTIQQLVDEGLLSRKLLDLDCFRRGKPLPISAPLYVHQEQAIQRIVQYERGVVVSSGTGSGKTETFLIPILNDLLVDSTPGVRAVLVYPLNALVNDQLDRLRDLLRDTNITFGRYTSELAHTTREANERLKGTALPNEVISREQIRKEGKLPQILITNYAMLEYLLLRPQDSPLFSSGAWRFIILDEAHTYTGSKGIEVGMLIRRLKLRLRKQPGDVRCIATSATLVNDNPEDAIKFAASLFGENFIDEDIIFGQEDDEALRSTSDHSFSPDARESYLRIDETDLYEQLVADPPPNGVDLGESLHQLGLISQDHRSAISRDQLSAGEVIYQAMERNSHLTALRQWMLQRDNEASPGPVSVQEAANYLFADSFPDEFDRQKALYHLIQLGAYARETQDRAPLLPARYHVFARAPQGVWVCLNPNCAGRSAERKTPWSVLYTAPHNMCEYCGTITYQLAVCRTCGQVYIAGHENAHGEITSEIQPGSSKPRYFVWAETTTDRSQVDPVEEDSGGPNNPSNTKQLGTSSVGVCLKCGNTTRCRCSDPAKVTLYRVDEVHLDARRGNRTQPVDSLATCLRCNDQARIADTEIATPITMAGSAPISVITTELYRRLPASPRPELQSKPGGGRKLLTFYDSRQGAARFAAYLQDVFNQDTYRYLVPLVVRRLTGEQHPYPPDFTRVSEQCVDVGWNELSVFQNDIELLEGHNLRPSLKSLSQNDRSTLQKAIQAKLLAEITSNRRSRQSLESLGLLVVDYFEDKPDLDSLVAATGLSHDQVSVLTRHVLDTLRHEKAVEFPIGVQPDDRVFGKNKYHPSIVRGNSSQSETAWFGKTERHRRFRLAQRALEHAKLPAKSANVEHLMDAIWNWLITESDLLVGIGGGRYRIALNRLFFSTPQTDWCRCSRCQRLFYRADALPCPHPTCGGGLEPIEDLNTIQEQNYYFQVLRKDLIPLRVEEHTAQLDSEKGRDYQNEFRDGNINILSCSTTFEMGIDLGDLQAVVLNNMPPAVANYRQRAGRAGRRAGGTAFIVTWAQDRPHDYQYFSDPKQIIRGHVRVPRIHLDNQEIRRRHTNAVLLSSFLADQYAMNTGSDFDKLGSFFDPQHAGGVPHVQLLNMWMASDKSPIVTDFFYSLGLRTDGTQEITDFRNAMQREYERYTEVIDYYRQMEDQCSRERDHSGAETNKRLGERKAKEFLVDTLSSHGVLPSYSFPLYTVELTIPFNLQDKQKLQLERDLRYAIREYAPGSEVVADKRLWVSGGLQFYRDTPKQYQYKLCRTCNQVLIADDPGVAVAATHCPICSEPFERNGSDNFVRPDGFWATQDSGKPAGQYVRREQLRMRSALFMETPPVMVTQGEPELISYGYAREGKIFYVNEGAGLGFRICMACGAHIKSEKIKVCANKIGKRTCGSADLRYVNLGHTQLTDTLHIRLSSGAYVTVPKWDKDFWYTLLYALLQAASKTLQIERQDIDGLLYPVGTGSQDRQDWEYSIVLYDSVPGGAGHVRDISQHLIPVIREAFNLISTCECAEETSCIHCLRDYYNQDLYPHLKRGTVKAFLQALLASLEGNQGISAIDQTRWLVQQVAEAKNQVFIAAETLTTAQIPSFGYDSWTDILRHLLRRGVEVTLILQALPEFRLDDIESIRLRHSLLLLLNEGYGLKLLRTDILPVWSVIIDPEKSDRCQAVHMSNGENLRLDGLQTAQRFMATAQPDLVAEAYEHWIRVSDRAKLIDASALETPSNVRVCSIEGGFVQGEGDITAIREFFAKPPAELYIYDPYLIDYERLVNRAGAYIELAQQQGTLRKVGIHTSDADRRVGGNRNEQNRAIEQLRSRFSGLQIDVRRSPNTEHDRWIDVVRADGGRARMLIGRGLDFIRQDGRVLKTYIVIQDPFTGR